MDNSSLRVIKVVIDHLNQTTGLVFEQKDWSTIESKLKSRARDLGFSTLEEYETLLRDHLHDESATLVSLLTTHHTSFFRESVHFEKMQQVHLPVIARFSTRKTLRVWSAAASRGQEAYTLAMLLGQAAPEAGFSSYEILATDIDQSSVETGKNGVYLSREVNQMPRQFLKNHWISGSGELKDWSKARDSLRSRIKFERANLLQLRNYSGGRGSDIVFCRNVFLYFTPDQIKSTVSEILGRMEPWGVLYLGVCENLNEISLPIVHLGNSIYVPEGSPHLEKKSINLQSKAPSRAPKPAEVAKRPIRVCIVDDSPTMTKVLSQMVGSDPRFLVVATVTSPSQLESQLRLHSPDVMTLDMNMPEMNGVEVLRSLPESLRCPAVVVSSLGLEQGSLVLDALSEGAVDYFPKPSLGEMKNETKTLLDKLEAAAKSKKQKRTSLAMKRAIAEGTEVTFSRRKTNRSSGVSLIAIGASTGGTEAILQLLLGLPKDLPPICIVQHIPPVFSAAFAKRLSETCQRPVVEAKDGMELKPGVTYIAPGDKHLAIKKQSLGFQVALLDTEKHGGHKPSVDVLFDSVSSLFNASSVGILLTGMGKDGAEGLLKMKQRGAQTICQSESSCVVFGMPRVAIEKGAATFVEDLDKIASRLMGALEIREAG